MSHIHTYTCLHRCVHICTHLHLHLHPFRDMGAHASDDFVRLRPCPCLLPAVLLRYQDDAHILFGTNLQPICLRRRLKGNVPKSPVRLRQYHVVAYHAATKLQRHIASCHVASLCTVAHRLTMLTSQRRPWSYSYSYVYFYSLQHSIASDCVSSRHALFLLCPGALRTKFGYF